MPDTDDIAHDDPDPMAGAIDQPDQTPGTERPSVAGVGNTGTKPPAVDGGQPPVGDDRPRNTEF